MAKKKTTPKPEPATAPNNVMKVHGKPEDHGRLLADLTVEGLFTSAVILKSYSAPVGGEIGITEAVQSLRRSVAAVNGGDLRSAETMLVGQAGALNAIFAELARRAGLNMGEYPEAFERYMRLALKAQAQARATLETLAAIKNPPVVFARQANINNGGQQQVNNGPEPARQAGSALGIGGGESLPTPGHATAMLPTQGISPPVAEIQTVGNVRQAALQPRLSE